MLILKILFLQFFWYVAVVFGKSIGFTVLTLSSLLYAVLDYYWSRPVMGPVRYFLTLFLFLLFGVANDYSLIAFGLIEPHFPLANISLWIVFISYYERIFNKFTRMPLWATALIGGLAGAFSYQAGAKLGGVSVIPGKDIPFLVSQLLFWALFFPVSLKMYYSENLWDSFLDKTIFFSFDRTGFLRHKQKFTEDLTLKILKGKSALVTGATGGIGSEVAGLLSRLGANVQFTGRNLIKGESFESQHPNSKFFALDMTDWRGLKQFARDCEAFDFIAFNAGSMPETYTLNDFGVEVQCASQLNGHYYLLLWLRAFQKLKPGARVVWVSSGGMYLKKLDLDNLFQKKKYDKVDTYANVKRAQVTLVEELAKSDEWSSVQIVSMHPGWVKTDGLSGALPGFTNLMKGRLREASEGADTILWCLLTDSELSSGAFYFDRKKVSPYISKGYIPTVSEREKLLSELKLLMSQID